MKIAFVIHYLGKLPEYFDLFAHTCKYNPSIDFLVFTDAQKPTNLPTNIHFYKMDIAEFKALADSKLGIKTLINSGYKLCDYKPLVGFLFEKYLQNYDFWGHCDIDLLLSNLSNFITEEMLTNYDIISVRKEWHSGSFALYRNKPIVNELFKHSKNWQEVFAIHTPCMRFDECGTMKNAEAGAYSYLIKGASILDLDTEIESFTHILEKIKTKQLDLPIAIYRDTCIKESLAPDMLLKYENGNIIMQESSDKKHPIGNTYLHYHYITEKKNKYFRFPNWTTIPTTFYIDETGFYTPEELPKHPSIRAWRKFTSQLYYLFRVVPKKIINKLKR